MCIRDRYGGELEGRGGWTWYTGSSSWMYEAGIKYILGLNIEGNILKIEPCIPDSWDEYSIRYKYGDSVYNIKVMNKKNTGEKELYLNGEKIEEEGITLQDNGQVHNVELII